MRKRNKKAIAVYLDDSDKMQIELSWLYKSWILNNLDKEWDLIVYYNPIASSRIEPFNGVIKVPMKPVGLSDQYPFLNSHYFCLAPYCKPLIDYEYVLKTDCDVFLTHNLKNYDPGNKFHFGMGGFYSNNVDEEFAQIQWIANHLVPNIGKINLSGQELDLRYRFITSVGASYLGRSNQVCNITAWQSRLTEELLVNHFEKSDMMKVFSGGVPKNRKKHQRVIGPNLAQGIASMIAGEIVVNSIFTQQHLNSWSLDTKCWKYTSLSSEVLHIHAWHTSQEFSKHDFFNDKYKDWVVHYDERLDNCANYCQWIATTPIEEIRKIAKKEESITTFNKVGTPKMSKREEYKNYLSGKRVCLVGPAPSVKQVDPAQGSQIDDYDVVVRINKSLPVSEDLKEFAGTKTNVLYNSVDQVDASGGKLDIPFLEAEIDWLVSPYPSKQPFSGNIKNFVSKNRDRIKFTTFELDYYNDLELEMRTRPNSGVLAILDLLSCDISELYITGITFFKGGYVEGYRDQTEEEALKLMARSGHHRIPPQIDYMKGILSSDTRVKMDPFLEEIINE